MMMKKFFALASMSAVAGVIAAGAMVGCSSSDSNTTADNDAGQTPDAAKTDGGKKSDGGGVDAAEPAPPAEEKTVGKICSTDSDCEVPDTANDNICSKGIFNKEGGDDLFPTPICIQPTCTPYKTGDDVSQIFCDGDTTGLCLPTGGGGGICFASCQFDNTGILEPKCAGNNKCAPGYMLNKSADNSAISVGFCEGACTADSDCVGTAGQKCQKETGSCVAEKHLVTYTKHLGDSCTETSTGSTECPCSTPSATATKGVCSNTCVTGAAGDTMCSGLKAGWKCSSLLEAKSPDGTTDYFTKQPDGIVGSCHLPCTDDNSCTALSDAAGSPFTCQVFAGGSFCDYKPAK